MKEGRLRKNGSKEGRKVKILRKEGRREGRKQGRQGGRKDGREEGRKERTLVNRQLLHTNSSTRL